MRNVFRPSSLATASLLLFCGGMLDAQPRQQVSTSISSGPSGTVLARITEVDRRAYHSSRVLVRFRGAPRFLTGSGAARGFAGDRTLFLVANPPGMAVAEAVRRYRANPDVVYAEPDYLLHVINTPADPLWSQQWDMVRIAAPAAWDTQTNSGDVVVAVIDTGIDYTHTDLQANLWVNPADNSHGYTCINTCVPGGSDDFGHGTHVAGTIGALANNGSGIAGINWSVQLMSLKFLDANGNGYVSDAVLAFDQVTALRQQGFNVRVTNNSWGGDGFTQSLKDAMSRAEASGIVHVCAAGNSGQNADSSPMYPAAYDNRGIVSVLASDENDRGAGFTNYGLASVDIGAPGVNILSTVPAGGCALCDLTGYRVLSGTSMAAPHVSAVLAALFHKNPSLQANEARDIILDPASYDAVTDTKAQNTSTGGRLNFAKAIQSPLLFSTRLNNFPAITMGPDAFVSAGNQINVSANSTDPDNDSLRMAWNQSTVSTANLWLFGWGLNALFPMPSTNSLSFPAPPIVRTATVPYDASVADRRGGGAHGREYVTVSAASSAGLPPSGTLTVTPTDGPAGSTITVSFPVTDPEGRQTAWDFWVGANSTAIGTCCLTSSSTAFTLNNPGVYRVSVQAIDNELNFSPRQTAVVRIGGATGEPPLASVTVDKLSGQVPLTVTVDGSTSTDADGTVVHYFFNCGGGVFTPAAQESQGTCTYDTPGPYWISLDVQDNSGNMDVLSAYVVATPAAANPPSAPVLTITSPADGSTVTRRSTVTIEASITPATSRVGRVDFLVGADVVCSDTSAPFSCEWRVPKGVNRSYVIQSKAYDANGQLAAASNTVTVSTR